MSLSSKLSVLEPKNCFSGKKVNISFTTTLVLHGVHRVVDTVVSLSSLI